MQAPVTLPSPSLPPTSGMAKQVSRALIQATSTDADADAPALAPIDAVERQRVGALHPSSILV